MKKMIAVVALVLEEEIKAMHHSNKFIGDAQDNMNVCRHKVNEALKEYGFKDLMIKRDEKNSAFVMTWQTGSTQSMKLYNRQQNKGRTKRPFFLHVEDKQR